MRIDMIVRYEEIVLVYVKISQRYAGLEAID